MSELTLENSLFTTRPINEDFLLYSALDVKYLISSLDTMMKDLNKILNNFFPEIKNYDIDLILRILSNDHLKLCCRFE